MAIQHLILEVYFDHLLSIKKTLKTGQITTAVINAKIGCKIPPKNSLITMNGSGKTYFPLFLSVLSGEKNQLKKRRIGEHLVSVGSCKTLLTQSFIIDEE